MDVIGITIREMKRCPRLTLDEERELGLAWRDRRDYHARERLILSVLPLAVRLAQRRCSSTFPLDECISLAFHGVVHGVDRFDPDRGRLTTHVGWYVNSHLLKAIGGDGLLIRLPNHLHYQRSQAKIKSQEVLEAAQVVRGGIVSLDEPVDMYSERLGTLGTELVDYRQTSVSGRMESEEQQEYEQWVWSLLDQLPARCREVIQSRARGETLKQIGERWGVCREAVRVQMSRATRLWRQLIRKGQNPMKYTVVLGVDQVHLGQLAMTWPTWVRHKPTLVKQPLVVFYDREQISVSDIDYVLRPAQATLVPWPPTGVRYGGGAGKWNNPQRSKMLSGFIHVAAEYVRTPYWVKVDTDVVATGYDNWVDPAWFANDPAIVAHRWSFTKPANQMMELDNWVGLWKEQLPCLHARAPLNLVPHKSADRLGHNRIIGWCGFYRTDFTRLCAQYATVTMGVGQLPVPSQDGYLWYVATRLGEAVRRVNLKALGWQQWHTSENIRRHAEEALAHG